MPGAGSSASHSLPQALWTRRDEWSEERAKTSMAAAWMSGVRADGCESFDLLKQAAASDYLIDSRGNCVLKYSLYDSGESK